MENPDKTQNSKNWMDKQGNQVKRITLRIDPETKEKLQEMADQKNISLSKCIKGILRDAVERNAD